MRQKYTKGYVKEYVESFGYQLLDIYQERGKGFIITIKCNNNHEPYTTSFYNFKKGSRCKVCHAKKKVLKYKDIKKYIESFGYIILSNEYKRSSEKLILKCPNGHEFKMSYNQFKSGHRCSKCVNMKNAKQKMHSHEYIHERFEECGYKWIDGKYKNNLSKLTLKCPNGHEIEMTYGNFQQGKRCNTCVRKKNGVKLSLTIHEVKLFIEKKGYELMSKEYINNSTKLKIKCPKGHEFNMSYGNFQQGQRCPKCNVSKGEHSIKETLNDLGINFIQHYKFDDCVFYRRLEFDFYIPSLNTIIEYDGIFHYSIIKGKSNFDDFVNGKIRDTVKNIYCENNGIKLIRIPYWDLDNIEKIIRTQLIN